MSSRRYSYTRATNPIRSTSSPACLINEKTTTQSNNDLPLSSTSEYEESCNTISTNNDHLNSIDEDDAPIDPSTISRASTGSYYSQFQIVFNVSDQSSNSSDDDDNENSHLQQEDIPSVQDNEKCSRPALQMCKSDTFLVNISQNKRLADCRRYTSTEGVTDDNAMLTKSDIAIEEEIEVNDEASTVPSTDTDDLSLHEEQSPPMDATFDRVRRNSSLSRRQSMSESDLYSTIETTPADDAVLESKKNKFLSRKNAIRKHNKEERIRHTRSQSVIAPASPHLPMLSACTPPPLPSRKKPLPPIPIHQPSPFSQEPSLSTQSPISKMMEKDRVGEFTFKKYKLHNPRNAEKLRKHLKNGRYDQVERDKNKDTALHAIVRAKRKDKHELLLVLMVYSDFGTDEVDIPDSDKNTALHIAMFNKDFFTVKILLSFGANINALNSLSKTPLDILTNENAKDPLSANYDIWELFLSLDGASGTEIKPEERQIRGTRNIAEMRQNILRKSQDEAIPTTKKTIEELEHNMNKMFRSHETLRDLDLQMSLGLQQFEIIGWKDTALSPLHFQVLGGQRILFLDGGGIRGLIQIEILSMIEKRTRKRIIDLFDWIVGTSTGGIVALGLVYGNKTLAEIRQFYFKMKDEVFVTTRFGFGGNSNTTLALEEILKETLTANTRMSDMQRPKVLVTAVNKTTTRPTLTFFNNCLDDEFSNEYIWKVARYTSAAPMYFSELDGYIDGGILANNPSDYGLTVIQNFYQRKDVRLDIACIVSIGSGIFPAKRLGSTDVHEMLLGMKMLKIQELQKRAKNLMTLLSNALVGADDVVKNCRSRCEAQSIPFHRFSPTFQDITVDSDETDDDLLINMLIDTRIQAMREWSEQLDELTDILSEQSRLATLQRLQNKKKKRDQLLDEKLVTVSQ